MYVGRPIKAIKGHPDVLDHSHSTFLRIPRLMIKPKLLVNDGTQRGRDYDPWGLSRQNPGLRRPRNDDNDEGDHLDSPEET